MSRSAEIPSQLLALLTFTAIILLYRAPDPIGSVNADNDASTRMPATVVFIDSGQALGSQDSSDVALADLDGDGDLDAFLANYGESGSFGAPDQVWINEGGDQNGTPGIYQDSGQSLGSEAGLALTLGDLDGDGDVDALVINDGFTDTIQVWLNQGGSQGGTAGVFAGNGQSIGNDLYSDVAMGLLNANSSPDIYIARSVGRTDESWTSDGSGQFSDSGQTLDGGSSLGVDLGDVDGDGDLDAFIAIDGANTVWLNQGGSQGGLMGNFADSGQTLGNAFSLNASLSDLDSDGDLDAFVVNNTADRVWLNQGGIQNGTQGVFADSGQALGTSTPQSRNLALDDLDGDGDPDALVAKAGGNVVWINQGGDQGGVPGAFADTGQSLGAVSTEGVALGDVDGDGDLDAFTANWNAPNKVWLNQAPPPLNAEGWQRQVIDTRGRAGRHGSLALDATGRPHLSYVNYIPRRDGNHYHILYAYWDGVRWHQEVLERTRNIGSSSAYTALAVDGNGRPHLAYTISDGVTGLHLIYNTWDGSQWQRHVVDNSGRAKGQVSLALDGSDRPHISYRRGVADTALYYATQNGDTWQLTAVDDDLDTDGQYNSLALDAGDHPHISYFDASNGNLMYAHDDGSGWQSEVVDSGFPDVGYYTSLEIDASGHPHISYLGNLDGEVKYAHWDDGIWLVETVINTAGNQDVGEQTSLALDDAGNPHIVYALDDVANYRLSFEYVYWDGSAWQQETLDNSSRVGQFGRMALDGNGRLHAIYHDQIYSDLRYLTWDNTWQTRQVNDSGVMNGPDLDLYRGQPFLSYYNQTDGLINAASWDTNWLVNPVQFVGNPVGDTSTVVTINRQHVSFYDADNQRLLYSTNRSGNWTTRIVDEVGDVGRHHHLLLVGGTDALVRIAYWDATSLRLKLARLDAGAPPVIYPNTLSPVLNANSGNLAAAVLPGGDIGVGYYDGSQLDLRFARWDSETETWTTDERVAGQNSDAGQFNSLQTDGTTGYPVLAYYDATEQAIRYASKNSGGWQITTAVAGVGNLTGLALELGLQSAQYPRISYTVSDNDTVYMALGQDGSWQVEGVAAISGIGQIAAASGNRPHLAFTSASGLHYAFRTATLDVDTSVFTPPPFSQAPYNPLDACAAVLKLFLGDSRQPAPSGSAGETAVSVLPSLPDGQIFSGMNALFSNSAGGQYYIDLYARHGSEMGQIGLGDPQLLWDAYGALQNFMPGLEALVTGRGNEVLVTQEMVDDALDIWQRLAAAGSPDLATAINGELAATNNLHDFVGMTFGEWAAEIGVLAEKVYLPVLIR